MASRSLSRFIFALKAANWAMAIVIAAAGGALFFSSLACTGLTEPAVPLDRRDSLAVLAILKANHRTWPRSGAPLDEDANGHATSLLLSGLNLDTIPPDIGDLIYLTSIDLSRNNLVHLPQEFERLTALERLDLSSNRFDSLPDGFTLSRLRELDLSHNRLTSLPRNVDVTALQDLRLDDNHIASLPPDFRFLRDLSFFSMEMNQLDSLPDSFTPVSHPNLKRLDLADNLLTALPQGMREFSLEYLDLKRNHLCLPDTAEADSTQRAMIDWLDRSDRDWRSYQRCP